jgi:hypothetical protein
MMTLVRNNDSLRSLSQIFLTPSNFRRIVRNCEFESYKNKVRKHITNLESKDFIAVVKFLYGQLETSYRNEYIYKNALLNQELLLSKYGLTETIVLNEFKVGNSIADFVLLNGEVKIFEIKTDLDGFKKLAKQIEDYQKFANKVFVVVSHKNSERLFEKYANSPVGITAFTDNGKLETIKDAVSFTDNFDHTVIFKTLRRNEYLEIIREHFGEIPEVPNTRIFRECLNLVNEIEICQFQRLVFTKLKQRNIKCPKLLKSNNTPKELKHICYTLNLSSAEYANLYKFLSMKI